MFKLYKKSVLQYIQYNRNTVWSHIHCPCSVVFTDFLPSKQNIWNYFTFHVYCVCTHSCYFFFEMFEMCSLSSSLWHFASCIGKKMDIVINILFSGASWTGWSFGPKENGHFRYLFKYLPILFMKKFGDQNHPHCFFREKFLKNPRKYFILSLNIYSHHKMGFM